MSRRGLGRGLVLALIAAIVTVLAVSAGAAVTGGCSGEAIIDGVSYGPENDTPTDAIVVPDSDGAVASWSGEVPFANTNFDGHAEITVGPFGVTVAEWSGTNSDDVRSASGEYSLGELKAALPVDVGIAGIYEVIVEHQADGGSCRANVFVRFDGNPLGTPLGLVTVVGLGLSVLGMFASMFKRGS